MKTNRNNSIIPPFLKEGDEIEIVASAKFISEIDLSNVIKFFKQHNLHIKFNNEIFYQQNVFAGTIEQRIKNINFSFEDTQTKAILFARGGYGSIQIIDHIDFNKLSKNPKWLIGFSDLTMILMHLYSKFNISSIHGPMAYSFKKIDQNSANLMIDLLKGKKTNINVKHSEFNIEGTTYGKLIGGNLSIICSLIGSESMLSFDEDYILFIEEVDEYLYHLERMIYMLDRAGVLKKIKGLVVGQMTAIMDNDISFGKTSFQLIVDVIKKYNYPVCFNFPIGHEKKNYPIIIGSKIKLEVTDSNSQIHYEQ
jgi:muramoyltetrapeptide carboxypeptidase